LLYRGEPFPAGGEVSATRAEFTFPVGPGEYRASVEDSRGGTDAAQRRGDAPGRLRTEVRGLRFLRRGEEARRDEPSVLRLRVLPGLGRPFTNLIEATADYEHCCCEQTAAKLRAGCAMWALAGEAGRRGQAEAVVRAGVRRQASMW